jgi:ankyrin repeat protein
MSVAKKPMSTIASSSLRKLHSVDPKQICREIISRGAVNQYGIEKYGYSGMPLMWAVQANYTEIAKSLIDHGANVNYADHQGRTALMWAAERGNHDVLKALLFRGANIDAVDHKGRTALKWAWQSPVGDTQVINELLDHGVNGACVDKNRMNMPIFGTKLQKKE